jgi:hypothetical protein
MRRLLNWLRDGSVSGRAKPRRRASRLPMLEVLEDRRLLSASLAALHPVSAGLSDTALVGALANRQGQAPPIFQGPGQGANGALLAGAGGAMQNLPGYGSDSTDTNNYINCMSGYAQVGAAAGAGAGAGYNVVRGNDPLAGGAYGGLAGGLAGLLVGAVVCKDNKGDSSGPNSGGSNTDTQPGTDTTPQQGTPGDAGQSQQGANGSYSAALNAAQAMKDGSEDNTVPCPVVTWGGTDDSCNPNPVDTNTSPGDYNTPGDSSSGQSNDSSSGQSDDSSSALADNTPSDTTGPDSMPNPDGTDPGTPTSDNGEGMPNPEGNDPGTPRSFQGASNLTLVRVGTSNSVASQTKSSSAVTAVSNAVVGVSHGVTTQMAAATLAAHAAHAA